MRPSLFWLAVAGCRPLPPPPVMAPHAPTEPDATGATTVIVAIGTVDQFLWGGGGWGIGLRVEHQTTDRTTLGGELTGGRGSEARYASGEIFRQSLIALRAYGRYAPPHDDELALGYGVGLSWMRSGLVTATLQTSFTASYPNDKLVPLASLSLALAIPLRHGRAFGDPPSPQFMLGEPEPMPQRDPMFRDGKLVLPDQPKYTVPKLDLYLGLDLGLLVPIGDTGNRLSLDLGAAHPMRSRSMLLSASAADAQTFAR